MKFIDMIGKQFGICTVIGRTHNNNQGEAMWICKCGCGNEFVTRGSNIRNGVTKSCGCIVSVVTSNHFRTHGMSDSRIYYIWSSMKARCYNKKCKEYRFYGERGIAVCEEWQGFDGFMTWAMQNGYEDNLTIERIDNNTGYCPENCKFIPLKMQARNTRSVVRVLTDNGYLTATETAAALGVSNSTIGRWHRDGKIKTFSDAQTMAERTLGCRN